MAYKSGFFNAIGNSTDGYDRVYNAEDMSNYFEGLITNGVYKNVADELAVKASTGMVVNVSSGRAMIDCHWIKNYTEYSLTLDTADTVSTRYDMVLLKLNKAISGREITIEIKKGTPGQSKSLAVPPANDTNTTYLMLARITIGANASAITQANIEDMRGSQYCGYVHGLIEQISTDTLFTQYAAAFEDWFSTLKSDLMIDTYVQKYRNSFVSHDNLLTYPIDISSYDSTASDILFVYVNGFLLPENKYTSTSTTVTFSSMENENDIEFVVLKSRIGSSNTGV